MCHDATVHGGEVCSESDDTVVAVSPQIGLLGDKDDIG
jgi:hypothetical protein